MKNEGFTLVELLAVLLILAFIALIAVPQILNLISESKEKTKERSFSLIEHAADLYLKSEYDLNGLKYPETISLRELKNKGYIENTDEDLDNNVIVTSKFDNYKGSKILYYEGRDKGDYKTLKELIESNEDYIKMNVKINGEIVNKLYGKTISNNYVLYSGQVWRVIETNDNNNSIKLVNDYPITVISYGKDNDYKNSWVKKWLNEVFYNALDRTDLITDTTFCVDAVDVDPSSYTKMESCTNKLKEKVGLLTYEDYIYTYDAENINSDGFLQLSNNKWLITPTQDKSKMWVASTTLSTSVVSSDKTIHPVISLKDNVLVRSGKGTKGDPYILTSERSIKESEFLNHAKVGDFVYMDESNNPYSSTLTTPLSDVNIKMTTDKIIYRIISINEDGSIKLRRETTLTSLPQDIAQDGNRIPFYSIDSGDPLTSCLYTYKEEWGDTGWWYRYYDGGCKGYIFNPNGGSGDFEINTGENIGYFLNNADNSFYNWFSDKSKDMIIKTKYNLYTAGDGSDYSNLNTNPNDVFPKRTYDGEIEVYVGLPYYGEMFIGRKDTAGFYFINRFKNYDNSFMYNLYNSGSITSRTDLIPATLPTITLSPYTYVTGGTGTFADPYTLDI